MTLARIQLFGFKKFESFSISFRERNVLVGPNNAGKSSVLDALRILADVTKYAGRRKPEIREWPGYGACASYTIQHTLISVPILNLCHNYSEDDAQLVIRHQNGNELRILLNPEKPVRAFLVGDGPLPRSPKAFRQAFPINVVVVPTLGPFDPEERWVTDETAKTN